MSLANIEMAINDREIWGTRLSYRGHCMRLVAQVVLLTVLFRMSGTRNDHWAIVASLGGMCLVAAIGHTRDR